MNLPVVQCCRVLTLVSALAFMGPVGRGGSATAAALEEPGPGSTYTAVRETCTITDDRLPEVSGAVGLEDGVLVVNDKLATAWLLDQSCEPLTRLDWRGPPDAASLAARDVEDLIVGPDRTVWLVDSGGNRAPRSTVSLLGITTQRASVEVVLRYPDGQHDAEAAFMTDDLRLTILTKERGRSSVYSTRLPLPSPVASTTPAAGTVEVEPVPVTMARVGVLDVASWADPDDGDAGLYLTGAAMSPDGRHVAVRTDAALYEWSTGSADPVASILSDRPVLVAQVDQLQGEAVTYSADGSTLLAFSEQLPSPVLAVDISRPPPLPGAPATDAPWTSLVLGSAGMALLLSMTAAVTVAVSRWRRTRGIKELVAP